MTMCGDWLEFSYSKLVWSPNNVKISTAVTIVKEFGVGIVFFYARSLKILDFRIFVLEIGLFKNEPHKQQTSLYFARNRNGALKQNE